MNDLNSGNVILYGMMEIDGYFIDSSHVVLRIKVVHVGGHLLRLI